MDHFNFDNILLVKEGFSVLQEVKVSDSLGLGSLVKPPSCCLDVPFIKTLRWFVCCLVIF